MPLSRRSFLKLAGANAGALAVLPPEAWLARSPDVVVIGAGAFGCWTAWYLRTLGARVTLVDTWGPGNSRATSGDETRGVRTSYGDKAHWIRWANEAVARWKEWDEEWSKKLRLKLFFTTGDLILRPQPEPWLTDTLRNWDEQRVPHEVLTLDEVAYRYPQISLEGMTLAAFETNAGVVRARRVCETVAEMFRAKGGKIELARAEPGTRAANRLTDVTLSDGRKLTADYFVFACGPWMAKVLPDVMADRLRTPLGQVFYFATPPGDQRFVYPNMPSWNVPGVTGWAALPPTTAASACARAGAAAAPARHLAPPIPTIPSAGCLPKRWSARWTSCASGSRCSSTRPCSRPAPATTS